MKDESATSYHRFVGYSQEEKDNMEKFTAWMEKNFVPVAARIGSQKHLVAIRDGFIGIMPITMAGAVATLLNVFARDLPNNYLAYEPGKSVVSDTLEWLISINGNVWWGTLAILAIAFSFSFGYNLAKAYDVNPLAGGLVSLSAFITVVSQSATATFSVDGATPEVLTFLTGAGGTVDSVAKTASFGAWGYIPYAWTNAQGLFTALILGLIATITYAKLMIAKVTIKLPEQVPPAVSKAFAAIIPGCVAIYIAAILQYLCITFLGNGVPELILEYIQVPFQGLSQGLFSVLILVLFVQVFWFFGLHGPNVLAPVLDGVYIPLLNQNTDAYNLGVRGGDLPFTWTRGSFDAFVWMGGSGCTIALLIAVFFFSKRDEARAVAKLSFPMGCFNINEPVIFGLPIVLNPIYFIPWLISPVVLTCIAYFATDWGIIAPVSITVPWVVPPVMYAFLATGADFMAAVVSALNLVIAVLIWAPFVIVANRMNSVE